MRQKMYYRELTMAVFVGSVLLSMRGQAQEISTPDLTAPPPPLVTEAAPSQVLPTLVLPEVLSPTSEPVQNVATLTPVPTHELTEEIPVITEEALPVVEATEEATQPTVVPEATADTTPTFTSPTATATTSPVSTWVLVSDLTFDTDATGWQVDSDSSVIRRDTGNQAFQLSDEGSVSYPVVLHDVSVSVQVQGLQANLQLAVRATAETAYFAHFTSESVQLLRGTDVVASMPSPASTDAWQTITLSALGETLTLMQDGTLLLTYTDPQPLPAGTVSAGRVTVTDSILRLDTMQVFTTDEEFALLPALPSSPVLTFTDGVTAQAELLWWTEANPRTFPACVSAGGVVQHDYWLDVSYPNYIVDMTRTSGDARYTATVHPSNNLGITLFSIPSTPDGRIIIYGPAHGNTVGDFVLRITGTSGSGCFNTTIYQGYRPQNQVGWGWASSHVSMGLWRTNTDGGDRFIRIERMEGSGRITFRVFGPGGAALVDTYNESNLAIFNIPNQGAGEYRIEIWVSSGSYRWRVDSGRATLNAAANVTSSNITPNGFTLSWTDNNTHEIHYQVWAAPSGQTPQIIATLPENSTSYAFTGMTCGMSRDIRVRAFNHSYAVDSTMITVSTPSCRPANDDLTAAMVLTGLPVTSTSVQAQGATAEASDPALAGCAATYSNSVWYTWQASAAQLVSFDTVGSPFDTVMAVYAGSPALGRRVACNDNIAGSSGPSAVSFTTVRGQVYTVLIAKSGATLPTGTTANALLNIRAALPTPTLSAPADNANIPTGLTTIRWTAVTGATGYELQYDDDPAFTSPVVVTTIPPNHTPPRLPQGVYHLRVRATAAAGLTSVFTAPRTFTVSVLSAPAANAVVQVANTTVEAPITFSWLDYQAGAQYLLQVATDTSFSNVAATSGITSLTSARLTLPAGQYVYRVQVIGQTPHPALVRSFTVSPAAPPAPRITAPLASQVMASNSVNLVWSAPAYTHTPLTYRVEVAPTAAFNAGTIQTFTTSALSHSLTLPTGANLRYVRVVALNSFGRASSPSAVLTINVNTNAPTIGTPVNDIVTSVVRPNLAITTRNLGTGGTVLFDMSRNSTFTNMVFENRSSLTINLALNNTVIPVPLSQGTYWVRAQVRDALGNLTPESTPHLFVVNLPTSPTRGQVFATPTATQRIAFAWATYGVPGTQYTLQVATLSDFSNIIYSVNTNATTHTMPSVLNEGTYFWRILVNGVTPVEVLNFFSVTRPAPPAPVLTSPSSGLTVNAPTQMLRWNPISYGLPFTYTVEVASNAAFTTPTRVFNITTTQQSFTFPSDGLWYWRVAAVSGFGARSVSAVRTLTLDTTAPAAPRPLLPADGNMVAAAQPTFTWSNPGGNAREYRVRISTDASFTNPLMTGWISGLSFTPPSNLANRPHWWQVQALDAAGNESVWSAIATFTPLSSVGSAIQTCRRTTPTLLLTWEPVTWATRYRYEVSRTPGFEAANIIIALTETGSTTITTPSLPNGRYYWRVQAQNPNGTWAPRSTVVSCTIDA